MIIDHPYFITAVMLLICSALGTFMLRVFWAMLVRGTEFNKPVKWQTTLLIFCTPTIMLGLMLLVALVVGYFRGML